MDLVIPVRRGDENYELCYALRSYAANLPHDNVWIIGYKPSWISGIEHIKTAQMGTKYANTTYAMRQACVKAEISDPFIYANDDMYALSPVDGPPNWHRGTIESVIKVYREKYHDSRSYLGGMIATDRLLKKLGHLEPLSYELHVPLLVHKQPMLEALDQGNRISVLHKRSMYGNLAGLGGDEHADVKVYSTSQSLPRGEWLSSSDTTFRGGLKQLVRGMFPEACRYER